MEPIPRRNWIAVMGGLIGAFMAILDIQITNASLKDIQGALSATLSESSWISTSYLVAEMIAIPLSGWLSRGLSVRRYLLWTTGAFIVASVLCSFSWNLTSMIVFRALQGFTGGALIPMAFSLIVSLLPLHKRATGMALFGLCATFAPAIGPTLGGWLTEQMSWHYIFYLNVPPGLLVMAMLAHGLDRKPVDWEVSFEPSKIDMLKAGETANVVATMKASKKALPGDYVATMTAKTPEVNTDAQFRIAVKTPMIWGWVGVLIIIVAIGAVCYLFRKYGRR